MRVLSRLFRRRFLEALEVAHRHGQLQFFGEYTALADPATFARWLAPLRTCEWVVYTKRPFAGPKAVLEYLSRYTHRVAISNQRLDSWVVEMLFHCGANPWKLIFMNDLVTLEVERPVASAIK